ncbi:MAG: acyl-CoA thioesterase [Cryomorphaceae bacterium]|nr:acyl-CoA thioesterase [Cryomorphaceae bacterium]
MYTHCSKVRVRYGETDQMGYVYYGNYPLYYEVGRVEAMRNLGIPYRLLEEKGVMLPVKSMEINYRAPAKYDDLLTIETSIENNPGTRLKFHHKIFNEKGDLLNTASLVLVFVDMNTKRPINMPDWILETIEREIKK